MRERILKRVLLVVAGIVLALIVLEGAIRIGYRIVRRHSFPTDEYRAAMLDEIDPEAGQRVPRGEYEGGRSGEAIHPYLGFVPDPSQAKNGATIGDPAQVAPASDTELIVGLFGGSFAAGLCSYAGGELRRVLATADKAVRLLCVAAGGYKQPQQFLALAYLLAQGAHFDLVINVDGFNEIALSPVENRQHGVAPLYPRGWFWRVGNVNDGATLKLLAEIAAVDRARTEWSQRFVDWQLHRSSLLALVWGSGDRLFGARWYRLVTALNGRKNEQRQSYAATGPAMTFADDASYYAYLARIWKDSSLQMKLLCDANGIAYAHFLQPNQHVEGSKSMTPEERQRIAVGATYAASVGLGYPLLRQQGEELDRVGVKFRDLTMAFKDVREPVYSDGCCHLNREGYVMLARAIGDAVHTDAAGSRSAMTAAP